MLYGGAMPHTQCLFRFLMLVATAAELVRKKEEGHMLMTDGFHKPDGHSAALLEVHAGGAFSSSPTSLLRPAESPRGQKTLLLDRAPSNSVLNEGPGAAARRFMDA